MGRRAGGHSFMPDKYVFPGGKVDRCDRFIAAHTELKSINHDALLAHNAARHPRAFALAAIRETWEETGLIVGRAGALKVATRDEGWTSYAAKHAIPDLAPLHFIARAITPPMRSKRFDARFFMADADEALLDDRAPQDGAEMQDLRWFRYEEAKDLDLPNVTRFILGEVATRLKEPEATHRPSFLRWTKSGHQMDRL
jgi:8-oxo-dGTP pyrophosphatase MutT (NUDIX family)